MNRNSRHTSDNLTEGNIFGNHRAGTNYKTIGQQYVVRNYGSSRNNHITTNTGRTIFNVSDRHFVDNRTICTIRPSSHNG